VRISYENNLEDLVAFNRYFWQRSLVWRKQLVWCRLVIALVAILGSAYLVIRGRHWGWGAPVALAGAIGVWWFPHWAAWLIDRTVRRFLVEGRNKGVLGRHELLLTDHALVETTETGSQTTVFQALEIIETAAHVYIQISSTQAHAIPRRDVDAALLKDFLDEVRRRTSTIA